MTSEAPLRKGSSIDEAAKVIKEGGVCAFPTETGYGLGAAFDNEAALRRIFEIKKRPFDKPLLILVNKLDDAPVEHNRISDIAKRLMKNFWPGPLTLLLPARKGLSYYLTGSTKKVGVRMSSNKFAQRLVDLVQKPITATSANLSGQELPKKIEDVIEQLKDNPPDYFLDGGEIKKGPASTIVDVTSSGPTIVRQGAIKKEDILSLC